MRPITKLTMCAYLAVAATGAAAQHAAGRYAIDLNGNNPGMVRSVESGATPTADRHRDQIEISSWSFGATQSADALTDGLLIVRYNTPPVPAPAPSSEKYGAVAGAHRDDSIAAPRDSASGQATGKRQHLPVRARSYAAPLDRGSVRVKVKFPWVGCTVGARYPKITLGDAARNYLLQDVTVASCGAVSSGGGSAPMEEVSFNYAKIQVRSWNPATKKE